MTQKQINELRQRAAESKTLTPLWRGLIDEMLDDIQRSEDLHASVIREIAPRLEGVVNRLRVWLWDYGTLHPNDKIEREANELAQIATMTSLAVERSGGAA